MVGRTQVSTQTSILVVAPDDPDQLLSSILSAPLLATTPLGPARVTWAHTLDEGLRLLASTPFEACILDSRLGPGSISFLRQARIQGWRRPLVFFTSVGEHDLVTAAQAAGASDVVVKSAVSFNTLGRLLQASIQRSRFEETLRFGEEMVRILVEGTRDFAIFMLDREGRALTWNQGAERITGYSQLDVLGHPFSMFFPEEDRQALRPAMILRDAVSHGRHEEESQRLRKDGTLFWAHAVLTPLYGPDGALRGFSKVLRDISHQREAGHDQGPRPEAFRASPIGTSVTRLRDGVFLDANDAFCEIAGYTRAELVGHPSTEFSRLWASPADRDRLADLLRTNGSYEDIELPLTARDGRSRLVRVSARTIQVDGETCVVATLEDITVRRFLQEQQSRREARLREGERLAGLGTWEMELPEGPHSWSPNLYAILGLEAGATASFETYLERVHPADRDRVAARLQAMVSAPAEFTEDHRAVRPDGSVRSMRLRGAVELDASGRPVRLHGTVQDVTEIVRAAGERSQVA